MWDLSVSHMKFLATALCELYFIDSLYNLDKKLSIDKKLFTV